MSSFEPVILSLDAMATRFEIVLYGADHSRLRAAGEEALAEIERLDRQLSFYRADSDISWINAHAARQPVKVEPGLFGLLRLACELHSATDGALDITVAPLMRVWGLTGGRGRVPSDGEISDALELVGTGRIRLHEADSTVHFKRDGMQIDLGAIGKGYAIDRAVETLRANRIESALLHGGTSTIYGLGSPPAGGAWRIGINEHSADWPHPAVQKIVDLRDSSLSVSAVHGKSFVQGNREYGHVIDPRNGRPSDRAALAAVWGPLAVETDALSTALLVLGKPGLRMLRDRYSEYRGMVVANLREPLTDEQE